VIVSLPTTATAFDGTLDEPPPPQPAATSTSAEIRAIGKKRSSLMFIL
jgi:hypothetical protein